MVNSYEEFTDEQIKILEHYVTSTTSNVFVLRNLPEVIKGALFSRYSRSTLGPAISSHERVYIKRGHFVCKHCRQIYR